MTALKQVLVDALNANDFDGGNDCVEYDPVHDRIHSNMAGLNVRAEPVLTAVRDHFLDREKVRGAINAAIIECGTDVLEGGQWSEDKLVDRLIEGLAR